MSLYGLVMARFVADLKLDSLCPCHTRPPRTESSSGAKSQYRIFLFLRLLLTVNIVICFTLLLVCNLRSASQHALIRTFLVNYERRTRRQFLFRFLPMLTYHTGRNFWVCLVPFLPLDVFCVYRSLQMSVPSCSDTSDLV